MSSVLILAHVMKIKWTNDERAACNLILKFRQIKKRLFHVELHFPEGNPLF